MALPKEKIVSPDVYETGKQIRKAREAAGLSQGKLAEKMDMSSNAISRYELGEREMGISVLYRFAEALHTTPDKLAPERFKKNIETEKELSELEKIFINLNVNDKAQLIRMAKLMRLDSAGVMPA